MNALHPDVANFRLNASMSGRAPRIRRAKPPDIIALCHDLLFATDLLALTIFGYAGAMWCLARISGGPVNGLAGALWREIILGSLLGAILMRAPRRKFAVFDVELLSAGFAQRGCVAIAVLLSVGLLTRALDDMARSWVVIWMTLAACWFALSRAGAAACLRRLASSGVLRESVFLLASERSADALVARLVPQVSLAFVQLWETGAPAERFGEMMDMVRQGLADTVMVSADVAARPDFPDVLESLKATGAQIAVAPDIAWARSHPISSRLIGSIPLAIIADRPLTLHDRIVKSMLDRAGAVIGLILLAPLMLAVAAAVTIDSPGPVLFRQKRSGWNGKSFSILKFRTMRQGSDDAHRQASRHDVRTTRIGRFLRASSLDELPQLLNVLMGDMSLVGPRPHADHLHEAERGVVAIYAQRCRMKPGMTGWAQVNGSRGAVATVNAMRERVKFDLYYIENWSIWLDLQILLRTPFCILSGVNAF